MDLTAVRTALSAQISANCGIRAMAQARDAINPPVAIVLPAANLATYGSTMDGAGGATALNLRVLIIISDAATQERSQVHLDSLLGIGPGEQLSVAEAVQMDPTLGGRVSWCEPVSVTNYGRLEYSGITYMGAVLNLSVGA